MIHGGLLVDKPEGITSFGAVASIKKTLHDSGIRHAKVGHGGTLDPFATGLLVILVGTGAKLARFFLNSRKTYEGIIRFGETSASGDLTNPITETSSNLPLTTQEIQKAADFFSSQAYLQTPPMFSAKKHKGKPLYLLARKGIEIEREPKVCQLYHFEITHYDPPHAKFQLTCSAGTYVRTLTQDLGRLLGTVAMLTQLRRTQSGFFRLSDALPLEKNSFPFQQLPSWVPFDQLLQGFRRVEATSDEAKALRQGKQQVLPRIFNRAPLHSANLENDYPYLTVYSDDHLVAVAEKDHEKWVLNRVFPEGKNQPNLPSQIG